MSRIRLIGRMAFDHTLIYNEFKKVIPSVELKDKSDATMLNMFNSVKDSQSNMHFLAYSFMALVTQEEYVELLEIGRFCTEKYHKNTILIGTHLENWKISISDMLKSDTLYSIGREFFQFFYKEHPNLWKEVSTTNGLIRISE